MNYFIDEFKNYISVIKNYSQNTVNSYLSDTALFLDYIKTENIPIENITEFNIMSYISFLGEKGKSSATRARALASVKLYFHFLQKEGVIKENPCEDIKPPHTEKKPPQILSFDEVEKLLSAPDISTKKGRRDKAMLELIYATGMRAGEIILLKTDDINLDLNYCICSSANGSRIIPFGKKAADALKNYITDISEDSTYIFGKTNGQPLSRQGFWKIIKEYAQKAGLNPSISPSVLRSSFAAHMINNGADLESVQELMGFNDINALNQYAKMNKKRIMDVYTSSHPRA